MTAVRARFAAFLPPRWWKRARAPIRRVVAAVSGLLAGVVAVAPAWWWHRLTAVTTGPGWRWLPILLVAAGGIVLVREAVRRWRRGGPGRGRPVAERVPLFGHVTVLLLLAAVVAAAVGTGLWLAFGRPSLATAGRPSAWSVENTFDAMKIMLAVVAGIGGVVALTVAYRKQEHAEAAEQRENTKLFNDRFGRAADQLGSGQAAVRLAGVYAMAGLADDWEAGRQTCIEVLCAYLRMPYTPPPAETRPPPTDKSAAALPLGKPRSDDDGNSRQEQQVRHTVLALIREHLRPGIDRKSPWQRHRFDLRGAVIDGGDLSRINVAAGTVLDLGAAVFPSGTVDFGRATFSGGTVNFTNAVFSGGWVDFAAATFFGGTVDFVNATFSGGTVNFTNAKFSGRGVDFTNAKFSGGEVAFVSATFSGGTVNFVDATFSRGKVAFVSATFSGGTVNFVDATFSGGTVEFVWAEFSGSRVNFTNAKFSGGEVNFVRAAFSGGTVNFDRAAFSGGTVDFADAVFSGGTVDFRSPQLWSTPPKDVDGGSTSGVL